MVTWGLIKQGSIILIISMFIVLFQSCRSENEEEFFGNKFRSDSNYCDTAYVTYSKQMKSMFDSKCISCHTGGSAVVGCDLDNYSNIMVYVNAHQPSTRLYDYVKYNTHQGIVLDSCELKKFYKWMLNPAP
jgi:hypothetical protein